MKIAVTALLLLSLSVPTLAAEPEVVDGDWLGIGSTDARGRQPFNADAVLNRYLLHRGAVAPKAGDSVTGSSGKPVDWEAVAADEKGRVGGTITYAYRAYESDRTRIVMATIDGGGRLWVNGTPYVGDVYRGGMGAVPVLLEKGTNHLFIRGVRGSFKLSFEEAKAPLVLTGRDTTVPDLVHGEAYQGSMAVSVANASLYWLEGVRVVAGDSRVSSSRSTEAVAIPPLGVMKLPVGFVIAEPMAADVKEHTLTVVATSNNGGQDSLEVKLKAKSADKPRRVTFFSDMDGSVQEYSVRPASTPEGRDVVLSLHGAGVDALGQARSYSSKPDMWIVAATNRRPFGFDWQDWGREDAYEVLMDATARFGLSRDGAYLTGHSMGGHGTWNVAANDPDGFLAIAPSAGWSQFDHYGGRPDASSREPWYGADGGSDTLSLIDNLKQVPAFVLHGEDDDNVPASEARRMLDALRAVGASPLSHFEPGKKHWWNGDAAKGADCVDWPGIFEHFRKHPPGPSPLELEWTSVGTDSDVKHHWVEVGQTLRYGERFSLSAVRVPETGAVAVDTSNVRTLRVTMPDDSELSGAWLDGEWVALSTPSNSPWFRRDDDGAWTAATAGWRDGEKRPFQSGPFKRALDAGFALVVGTAGTPDENRELMDRARYDAATWKYRGNGLARVMTDTAFAFSAAAGNVVLYGNADTNAAWDLVFTEDCPIRATRGKLTVGRVSWERDDLGALFVQHRRGGGLAAAFADTGPVGSRLGHSLLTFVSGVGYPDWCVFGPDILTNADGGVIDAGWFDHRWQLQD